MKKSINVSLERKTAAIVSEEYHDEPKKQKLAKANIFGTSKALFECRTIKYLISLSICERLQVVTKLKSGRIKMTDGTNVMVLPDVHGVAINVGVVTTKVSCLVLCESPFALIMEGPYTKNVRPSLEHDKDMARFRTEEGVKKVPLLTEGAREAG